MWMVMLLNNLINECKVDTIFSTTKSQVCSLDHNNEAAVDLHYMKIKVFKKFGQTISSVDVFLTLPYLTLPYLTLAEIKNCHISRFIVPSS